MKYRILLRWHLNACCLILSVFSLSCATLKRDIETPTGAAAGEVRGPFVILGVINRLTSTGNRPHSPDQLTELVDLDVPTGTEVIVPCLRGAAFHYGSLMPVTTLATAQTWSAEDHNFGVLSGNVSVDHIYAVDPVSHTQKARIKVTLLLSDGDGQEQTNSWLTYSLLCLGPEPH